MKKIYYEKQGRKYVPVAEYDSDFLDGFPKGNHLVMCYPGGQSRRFHIDPAYAPMIAAGRVAEDAICSAILKAMELRPQRQPITERQKKLWNELAKSFKADDYPLFRPAVRDAAEAGLKAMQNEAMKLMEHPSVKEAYEHFLFVAALVKDENKKV